MHSDSSSPLCDEYTRLQHAGSFAYSKAVVLQFPIVIENLTIDSEATTRRIVFIVDPTDTVNPVDRNSRSIAVAGMICNCMICFSHRLQCILC